MRLTYLKWSVIYERMTGRRILDPDGFREQMGDNLPRVDYDKTYTLEEFVERVAFCTTGPVNVVITHQVSDTAGGSDSVGRA